MEVVTPPSKMNNISFDAAKKYIQNLDLTYIIENMCSEKYFLPRWSKAEAELCCKLYKNYLLLFKKYLHESIVPTREVDEFWHNHILYTKNYMRDCMNIYGQYLHHEPTSSSENTQILTNNYLKTKELYFKEFGESLKLITPA